MGTFKSENMIRKIAFSLWIGLLCNHVLAQSPEAINNFMAEGVALMRERAAKGDPNHQYGFATMHIAGAGVPEDPTEAAKMVQAGSEPRAYEGAEYVGTALSQRARCATRLW